MEKENHENIPSGPDIIKAQNDNIDSKNNLNTQNQLKDNTQDNAEIVQINDNNNNANNNIDNILNNNIDINNNVNNNNIIKVEMNNKNNEEKNNYESNTSILKQTTNKNLPNPIINQDINGNNFINNQSPNQVAIECQQNNNLKEDISCKEKYYFCFCNIKVIFCYNCFDTSEENQQKRDSAPIYKICCLGCFCYYLFFIISEILLFIFIILKQILICLYSCLIACGNMCIQTLKEAEIESAKRKKEEMERNKYELNQINNRINDLDNAHNKMDRTIHFGNVLNDPEYQARKIDHYDREYDEQRKSLERQRSSVLRKMSD